MEDETLKALKDLAAHNFIPKALVVGTLGNLINFVILSRTCIRSSANIYLSILAFADIFFMLLIYVSSKQYHDDVHHQTYEIYWRMFGLSHWFYTAFLYITVFVTLSLAWDRYAAVSHPTRAKCGIVRAKNVVSMILFASFLFSISAAFEFQLVSEEYKSDELCKSNRSQVVAENATTMMVSAAKPATDVSRLGDNEKSSNPLEHNDGSYNFNEDESMSRLERSFDNDVFFTGINSTDDSFDYSKLSHKTSYNPADADHYVNDAERDNAPPRVNPKRNHNTCSTHFYLYPVESALAKNKIYQAVSKSVASILLILPMGALLVLSCTLTASVCRVIKARCNLARLPTGGASDRRGHTQTDALIRENRVTLLVITLVVIFLICHTPNAAYLLYKSWLNNRQTFSDGEKIKNFILAMELSCQILMSINCCSKIFIYMLMYDEFWTSMKSLKNCFDCSTAPGEQIINTSKHLFPSTKADVESLLNYSLNKKSYCTQIPPEARHHQHPILIPRTHKPSYSSSTPNNSITPRLSLTPADNEGMEMGRRTTNRISPFPQVERNPSMRSNISFRALQLSPSQASLTRSKSLNIQSTMKHSPNCRLNKKVSN